jgi:cobalt-zinc-cadmium efflux system outer membrane protein
LAREVDWSSTEHQELLEQVLEDGVLSMEEATALALVNNNLLRARLEELEIGRAQVLQAVLPSNLIADGAFRFIVQGSGFAFEGGAIQNLLDLLLIPRRKQVATARLKGREADVTAAVVDLVTEVRTTYRDLQAQHDLVALYTRAAEATFLSYDAARRLRDAGNIIELDMLTERALHEEIKVSLAQAQSRAMQLRESLALVVGWWAPSATVWDIDSALPPPAPLELDRSTLESRVVEASLDLEAKRQEIIALGKTVGLERLEVLFSPFAAGVSAEKESGGTWGVGPVVVASVPLFNFGQGASAETQARVRRAYDEYTNLALRVRALARATYFMAATAQANSQYLREVLLPLRSQVTLATQEQMNAMQIGVFQVITAKRREIATAQRYIETLRDYWIGRARLEALLMGRMPRAPYGLAVAGSGPGSGAAAAAGQEGH